MLWTFMYIVAIGWAYVVMMMSISEDTPIAGVMTFLLYGALPLTIILYIGRTGVRKRRGAALDRQAALRKLEMAAQKTAAATAGDETAAPAPDPAARMPKRDFAAAPQHAGSPAAGTTSAKREPVTARSDWPDGR